MKSLVLVLLLCTLFYSLTTFAADNSAIGKWDCVSDDGHGTKLPLTLTLTEAGGKLSGDIVEAGATMPLIDPAFDGKVLTFKSVVNDKCTLLFKVNVDGNKLSGSFACPEVSGTLTGKKQG